MTAVNIDAWDYQLLSEGLIAAVTGLLMAPNPLLRAALTTSFRLTPRSARSCFSSTTTSSSKATVILMIKFYFRPIRYSFDAVRITRLPRTIAGVAMVISSSEFLPNSL